MCLLLIYSATTIHRAGCYIYPLPFSYQEPALITIIHSPTELLSSAVNEMALSAIYPRSQFHNLSLHTR
jgi:hypothetical protein